MSENRFSKLRVDKQSSLSKEVQSSACGKAIIVGEHAAVYGARAVAMPLPSMRFHFALNSLISSQEKSPQIQLKLAGHDVSPRIQAVVLKAMRLLGIDAFSLSAKSHTTVPIGAGLGSSATLCVAVLRALAESHSIAIDRSRLAFLANELEKSFHGNPSGLDAAVVAFEECVLFAKGQAIKTIPVVSPRHRAWEFALIDSGLRASTLTMIRLAEPFFKGTGGDLQLQRFDELARGVQLGLAHADTQSVGEAMNVCDELLRAAGVVPDLLSSMISKTRSCGVLGAKTTGAGGGGMILALLDPEQSEDQLQALKGQFREQSVFHVRLQGEFLPEA